MKSEKFGDIVVEKQLSSHMFASLLVGGSNRACQIHRVLMETSWWFEDVGSLLSKDLGN